MGRALGASYFRIVEGDDVMFLDGLGDFPKLVHVGFAVGRVEVVEEFAFDEFLDFFLFFRKDGGLEKAVHEGLEVFPAVGSSAKEDLADGEKFALGNEAVLDFGDAVCPVFSAVAQFSSGAVFFLCFFEVLTDGSEVTVRGSRVHVETCGNLFFRKRMPMDHYVKEGQHFPCLVVFFFIFNGSHDYHTPKTTYYYMVQLYQIMRLELNMMSEKDMRLGQRKCMKLRRAAGNVWSFLQLFFHRNLFRFFHGGVLQCECGDGSEDAGYPEDLEGGGEAPDISGPAYDGREDAA